MASLGYRQTVSSYTARYRLASTTFVNVVCLHHVTIAIFVYISKVKVRLMVLHGAILSAIIRSTATFVYVICLHIIG
jgi:hypothetical protein